MSVVVLKVGGASTGGVGEAVAVLRDAGSPVVVVHGAGPQISQEMERRGLEVRFVRGRRVTTWEGLQVVRESLETVNAAVCAAVGPDAVGLGGDEIRHAADRPPERGLVGPPLPSRPPACLPTPAGAPTLLVGHLLLLRRSTAALIPLVGNCSCPAAAANAQVSSQLSLAHPEVGEEEHSTHTRLHNGCC